MEGGKVCEIGLLFQYAGPHSMPSNRGLWLLTPPRPHLPLLALMAAPGGLSWSTLMWAAKTLSVHIAQWGEGKMERTGLSLLRVR